MLNNIALYTVVLSTRPAFSMNNSYSSCFQNGLMASRLNDNSTLQSMIFKMFWCKLFFHRALF